MTTSTFAGLVFLVGEAETNARAEVADGSRPAVATSARRLRALHARIDAVKVTIDRSGTHVKRHEPLTGSHAGLRSAPLTHKLALEEYVERCRVGRKGTSLIFVVDASAPPLAVERLEAMRSRSSAPRQPIPFFVIPRDALEDDTGSPPGSGITEHEVNIYLERLRGTRGPILIEGETGVGKTRLARRLHETLFARRDKPFREINCAALDPSAPRISTLFRGVADGVYTGVRRMNSIFKDLDGGTLFLDEFQELERPQQAMLLDLLSPFSTRGSCPGGC